uniref:Uncharacterized protein n=1 Tax=Leersia perrieri TaxID=77586 RepID=A0A0D9V6E2_9ORYZ
MAWPVDLGAPSPYKALRNEDASMVSARDFVGDCCWRQGSQLLPMSIPIYFDKSTCWARIARLPL